MTNISIHLVGWFPNIKHERSTPWAEIHNSGKPAIVVQFIPELSKGKRKVPPYAVRFWDGENIKILSTFETLAAAEDAALKVGETMKLLTTPWKGD